MLQIMELRSNLRGGGYEMRAFSVPQLAFWFCSWELVN
jgi:hypothetical protein